MADFGEIGGFDANNVAPVSFEAIPAGDYDAVIVESGFQNNSAGTGKYLKLKLQVLNGQYQNKILWDNLNLMNPSDKAVQIAKGTLSSICRAVGVMTPRDSSQLHNLPLRVTVAVEQSAEFGAQNKIKAYKPRHAQATGIATPLSTTPAANNAAPASSAPANDIPF